MSKVLCKCSGKYIDIYFILKITFHMRLSYTGSRTIDSVAWPCLPCPFQSLSPYS